MTVAMATSLRPEGCAEYFPGPCSKTGLSLQMEESHGEFLMCYEKSLRR